MNSDIEVTPVEKLARLSSDLGIDIWVKRDDLFPRHYGGNKARKISYILNDAIAVEYDAIVTAGSPISNHARVCALAASKLGWACSIILHPEDPSENLQLSGNLLLMRLAGAKLIISSLAQVSETMDHEMERLRCSGYRPFYIWGGGHCVNGSLAYYLAVSELKSQIEKFQIGEPDFIIVASGTGSTHAGIHLGASCFFKNCKVIGISIARKKKRGQKIIQQSVKELISHLNLSNVKEKEVIFRDEFIGLGYGNPIPQVARIIRNLLETEALALDPIYTGKAFWGLETMIRNGEITKGSRVIFWHTGGLINLLSSPILDVGIKESR